MSTRCVTRRQFLGTVAAVAAPAIVPPSIFGRDHEGSVMLAPDSLRKVDAFWAGYFGCHAKAVISSTVTDALRKVDVALWRTLEANEGAVALAKGMGFKPYASTYEVQLTADEF